MNEHLTFRRFLVGPVVLLTLTLTFFFHTTYREAFAGNLYFATDFHRIRATTTAPSGMGPIREVVTETLGNAHQVDYSRANDRLYWAVSSGRGQILSSRADGSDVQTHITIESPDNRFFTGLAIDDTNQLIYYTDKRNNAILRSSPDGSNLQVIVPEEGPPGNGSGPQTIRIDESGGKIYWTDNRLNRIWSANLDGSDVDSIISTSAEPYGIDLDLENGKVYWSELGSQNTGTIRRANFDGTSVELVLTSGLYWPTGVAIDSQHDRLYWTDTWLAGPLDYPSTLQSSDLSGGDRQILANVAELGSFPRPVSLTFVVPEPGSIVIFVLGLLILFAARWDRQPVANHTSEDSNRAGGENGTGVESGDRSQGTGGRSRGQGDHTASDPQCPHNAEAGLAADHR